MTLMSRSEVNQPLLTPFNAQLHQVPTLSTPAPRIPSSKRKKSYDDEKIIPTSVKRCNSNPTKFETYLLLYAVLNTDVDVIDRLPMTYIPNQECKSKIQPSPPTTFDYSCYWTIKDKDILTSTFNRAIPSNAVQYIKSVVTHCFEEIVKSFPPDPALYQYATIDEVIKQIMVGKKGHSLRETCCHEHYPTSYDVYTINGNYSSQVVIVNRMNDLMNLYERYPYLKRTIVESIAVKFQEETEYMKHNYYQIHNYNHLIKFCIDLRIYNIDMIKTILNLFLSDRRLFYFTNILIYLHKIVYNQPEYVPSIISILLKTKLDKPASVYVGIAKIFQDFITNSPRITIPYTSLIFNYCLRLSNLHHSYILVQTLMTLKSFYIYLNQQQQLQFSVIKLRILEEIKDSDIMKNLNYIIL